MTENKYRLSEQKDNEKLTKAVDSGPIAHGSCLFVENKQEGGGNKKTRREEKTTSRRRVGHDGPSSGLKPCKMANGKKQNAGDLPIGSQWT
jgi:hypothetical protein